MQLREFANHNMSKILDELTDGILAKEPWGQNNKILQMYINNNFEIAESENKVYEDRDKGIAFWKVGYLTTEAAEPLWFVYQKNRIPRVQFWDFKDYWYGNTPIELDNKTLDDFQITYNYPTFHSSWQLEFRPEAIDHIMIDNKPRLEKVFGDQLAHNPHMLFRTIMGELELQRRKSDVYSQWYHGTYQFLMPLYLTSSKCVDLTATLEPQEDRRSYNIRTLLYPEFAYPHVRSVVKNRSELIGWMNIKDETLNSTNYNKEQNVT